MNTQASKVELGDIFARFGAQYRQQHKLPLQHRNAMFAIEHCRTSTLGAHVASCDSCDHKRISYNSCRNRHCPKCQGLNRIQWVDKLSSNLLPVRYFHIVFTIPSQLNRLSLVNQKCLYDILFKAASESLLMLAKDSKHLNAETGLVAVLHTWGQNLTEHPHLHTIVAAGGWSEMAGCWKPSRKKFFIPVKVISAVFRGKFLALLKQAYDSGDLKFEGEIKNLQSKSHFKNLLNELYKKDWVIYAKKPFKNAAHIINYLGRYTHRTAISNWRIESIDDNNIIFKWKDYKDGGKQKLMKLPAEEFIRRFLLHILPKGFFRIRYYGIISSRKRKTFIEKCRNALGRSPVKSRFAGLSRQDVLQIIFGPKAIICPVCKNGTMSITAVLKGYRGPPVLN